MDRRDILLKAGLPDDVVELADDAEVERLLARHAPGGFVIPVDPEHLQAICEGLADCVSCETGSPSPCPTCGRTDDPPEVTGTITGTQAICRDEDCPKCGWLETYADVDFGVSPPNVLRFGCRKCGWLQEIAAA